MADWGSGFAQGLTAGTNAAGKWIGAYENARDRYQVDQAMQPQGNDMTEVGVDFLKQKFGLDDAAANTMLNNIRADPTKARSLLNATNMVTGGAAGTAGVAAAAGGDENGVRTSAIDMSNPQGTPLGPRTVGEAGAQYPDQISRRYPNAAIGNTAAGGKPTPQQAFATGQYGPMIQSAADQLQVHPSLVAGQWGHETGWGKSVIPGTNNLGNIKDFSGGGVRARDKLEGSNDAYRQYDNPEAFVSDYVKLMKAKYPGVVGAGEDVDKFITGLKGYATDPDYGKKLKASVESVRKHMPGGNMALAATSQSPDAKTTAPAVQAAIQTPEGRQEVADDITKMQQVAERMRIPKNAEFAVGPDGKVSMSTPKSDADMYLNVAKTYLRQGKAAEAKQAMDMHFQTKAKEAADYVTDILKDDSLDADAKIGALANGTGIRIYKDKDGSYVSPDLTGGPGEGGKHKRLGLNEIAQYANLMTTPEGMKYLYGHQLEQQKATTAQRKVALEERQEGTATTPGSQARLREAQASYYDARPDLETAKINARAAADAAKAAGKEPGGMKTTEGEIQRVNLPTGKDGAVEGHELTMFNPPPGVTGGSGFIRKGENEKIGGWQKELGNAPYMQPGNPTGIDMQIRTVPIQLNQKSLTPVDGAQINSESGKAAITMTAIGPSGKPEHFVMRNGKPVWESELGGVPAIYDAKDARKQADEMAKYQGKANLGKNQAQADARKAADQQARRTAINERASMVANAPGRRQAMQGPGG